MMQRQFYKMINKYVKTFLKEFKIENTDVTVVPVKEDPSEKIVKKNNFELGFSMERAITKSLKKNPFMISRYDCNDMPLGKSDIFVGVDNLFKVAPDAKWFR